MVRIPVSFDRPVDVRTVSTIHTYRSVTGSLSGGAFYALNVPAGVDYALRTVLLTYAPVSGVYNVNKFVRLQIYDPADVLVWDVPYQLPSRDGGAQILLMPLGVSSMSEVGSLSVPIYLGPLPSVLPSGWSLEIVPQTNGADTVTYVVDYDEVVSRV